MEVQSGNHLSAESQVGSGQLHEQMELIKHRFIDATKDFLNTWALQVIQYHIQETENDQAAINNLMQDWKRLKALLPVKVEKTLGQEQFWAHLYPRAGAKLMTQMAPYERYGILEDVVRELTGEVGELLWRHNMIQSGLWEVCFSRDTRPRYRYFLPWTPAMEASLQAYRQLHSLWLDSIASSPHARAV